MRGEFRASGANDGDQLKYRERGYGRGGSPGGGPPIFGKKRLESAKSALDKSRAKLDEVREGGSEPMAAEALLKRAQEFLEDRQFEEAERQAKRARELADALEEHEPAVRKAILEIEARRDEMRAMGLDVSTAEGDIAHVREVLSKGYVKVKGKVLPGPEYAVRVATRIAARYAGRLAAYADADKAIAAANAALNLEISSHPHIDPMTLQRGIWRSAFDSLDKAQTAFSEGRYDEARDLADWASALSRETRERFEGVLADYEVAEASREKLAADGILANTMLPALGRARDLIQAGELDKARERAREARQEAERTRHVHGEAAQAIRQAEATITEVSQWGFKPLGASGKLEEAGRLLQTGDFDGAKAAAEAARQIATSIRETHRDTAERIGAARTEVQRLTGPAAGEGLRIEALLLEAERDLEDGNYKGCQQNLELAVFMLDEAKRAAP